jgi:hypothetical protein
MEKHVGLQSPRLRFLWSGMLFVFLTVSPCLALCEPSFEENLEWCKAIAIEASDKAIEAQTTCDYPTANQAFKLADEAAYLAAKIGMQAQDASDPKLALAAYNVCNHVEAAISAVIKAARHIEHHGINTSEVQAAKFLLEDCESTQRENRVSMETALAPVRGHSERAEAFSKE